MTAARIASLLPSATEILFALGLGDRVVGVSHECDFPPEAATLPRLTRTSIDAGASSAAINQQVRDHVTRGLSLYEVNDELLRELSPDLIVTQDTCEVCAVSFADVERATAQLVGDNVQIVSLSPLSVDDVFRGIVEVARAAGDEQRGQHVSSELRARLESLRARTARLPHPKVLALEWLDPPMVAGHWTPELIRAAGGEPVLGHPGAATRSRTWSDIADADPDVLLVIPCGFRVKQSLAEMTTLVERPEVSGLRAVRNGKIAVIDGNAFFNRPGPRLVESAELAFAAIHPRYADVATSRNDLVFYDAATTC